MAENTAIEWADHTFNPWVGCTKVSPGCDHCYAESWAKRAGKAAGVEWGGERRRTSEANWRKPLQWNKLSEQWVRNGGQRARVFCASLADVFDNQVPAEWRADLFRLILDTPHLDWLLLTKRIGNVQSMLDVEQWEHLGNVWLGATVVNQAEADRDVPKLLQVPARVRFLSIEPMLGPIKLDVSRWGACYHEGMAGRDHEANHRQCTCHLDWVICGGESGPGARPMHPDWARGLRDQCAAAGVPFLFKQWGEWAADQGSPTAHVAPKPWNAKVWPNQVIQWRAGKKAAGRQLDGRTHDEFPRP